MIPYSLPVTTKRWPPKLRSGSLGASEENIFAVKSFTSCRYASKLVSSGRRVNLGREVFVPEKLEFYGDINFLKGGIVYSDAVTVSSEEYLAQIRTKEGGCGLEGLVECSLDKISVVKRSDKFVEIYKKLI